MKDQVGVPACDSWAHIFCAYPADRAAGLLPDPGVRGPALQDAQGLSGLVDE